MIRLFCLTALLGLMQIPAAVLAQVCRDNISATASAVFFETSDLKTLPDKRSKLIWSRCAFGQQWSKRQCIGTPEALAYKQARQAARQWSLQEKQPWRLPTVAELSMLVELRCHTPAIDLSLFPNTPSGSFWTSTRFVNKAKHHWQIQFRFGANHVDKDNNQAFLRLVRDRK